MWMSDHAVWLIDVQGDVQGSGRPARSRGGAERPPAADGARLGVRAASLYHLAWAPMLSRVSGRGMDFGCFGTRHVWPQRESRALTGARHVVFNTCRCGSGVGAASVEESVRQTHQLLTELMMHEHASWRWRRGAARLRPGAAL